VSAAGPVLVELAHRFQHRLAVLLAEEERMPQTSPSWRLFAGRRRRTSSSPAFAATVAELAIGAPGGELTPGEGAASGRSTSMGGSPHTSTEPAKRDATSVGHAFLAERVSGGSN
jgi:hypothetical protein